MKNLINGIFHDQKNLNENNSDYERVKSIEESLCLVETGKEIGTLKSDMLQGEVNDTDKNDGNNKPIFFDDYSKIDIAKRNQFENMILDAFPKLKEIKVLLTKKLNDKTFNIPGSIDIQLTRRERYLNSWFINKDKISSLGLFNHISTLNYNGEDVYLIPYIPTGLVLKQKISMIRVSNNTHWGSNINTEYQKYLQGEENDSPNLEVKEGLPSKIAFVLDSKTYLYSTIDGSIIESYDYSASEYFDKRDGFNSTGLDADLENKNYLSAASKVVQYVFDMFLGTGKDPKISDYYDFTPLIKELDHLSEEDLQKKYYSLEILLKNEHDPQRIIRLTRCLSLIKDKLPENHHKNGLSRIKEECEIGDLILLNKQNSSVNSFGGKLGEMLLEGFTSGYGFTHVVMVTKKNPFEFTHSSMANGGGVQTENLDHYANDNHFDAMVLKIQAPDNMRPMLASNANSLVGKIGYDNKSAISQGLGKNDLQTDKDNCVEFVSRVLSDSLHEYSSLRGEAIPNNLLKKHIDLFKPTYSVEI